ncbi:band 4.1-like protein 3 isoform X7 [Tachysurus fulvidraco]|uniref:band 4.1-like protein 3 isoform X7 n=1 Tax=Tachysurus fulvidraco TaxID=1234273 RepID=UPI001FEFDAB9|nr:band 4.1-like protein 3 isoform X7 [Tachysurus fulvidraco]
MECRITLLDGTDYTCTVEKKAKGQVLFDKVCDHLNLMEKDYFGLTYRDAEHQKNWMDPLKELKKQIRTGPWNFGFNVKFYPPDPSQLSEDISRYYLCLQLRDDVVSGRLPCSFVTHSLLGSYIAQSELGDYDPDELANDYISDLRFAPNQTKELEEKVMDLHRHYKGMSPAEAEMLFLENAKKLSMYGVDLHHAKDSEGVEIMLGVCSSGLLIYRDRLRINRFAWPKILKISYKRNSFYIKIRPGEVKHLLEQFESTIGFKLPNHKAAKRLWKVCVEHHTFFRLVTPEPPAKKFLSLGSKFRYSGRTQTQARRASSQISRCAPQFQRSSSKRLTTTRSLDIAPAMANDDNLIEDSKPAFATGTLITTVTPEKKAEEENAVEDESTPATETSGPAPPTPVTKTDSDPSDETTTESEPEDESELMTQEVDAKKELLNRQAKLCELKRLFVELSSESSESSEWDKKLSSFPSYYPRLNDTATMRPLLPRQDTAEDAKSEPPHDISEEKPEPVEAHSAESSGDQQNTVEGEEEEAEVTKSEASEKPVQTVTTEVPIVHTETKTITYESAEVDANGDADPGVLMSAQTITSENNSTQTTTQITKTVKGGISETRIEKRIIISGDANIDHDQALAQAIKEIKEQHPDMSVTKVVVHKETEISSSEGDQ